MTDARYPVTPLWDAGPAGASGVSTRSMPA